MAKQVQKLFGGGGGGVPRGAGLGLKLLGAAAVVGIGINQSMYTGELDQYAPAHPHCMHAYSCIHTVCVC